MACVYICEQIKAAKAAMLNKKEGDLLGADKMRSDETIGDLLHVVVHASVPWRARLMYAALVVGLLCGVVACLYDKVLEFILEKVWEEGSELYFETFPGVPQWSFIPLVCITFGSLTGVLLRVLGEPMANLPGVVLAAHRDGVLGHEEAPAMAAISLTSITAAGSLGPEAPLVSIGGGLASMVSLFIDLSEAETLFVTMCGMGAGLAAFFGEPLGGALFACEVIHRYGIEYYEAVVPTVIAGLACNWSFRVLADLPQEPIWTFPAEAHLRPWTSILGIFYGIIGGLLGWAWMRMTNTIREKVMVPLKLGPRHILKGLIGGVLISLIGITFPETLFWAEFEAQTIISAGANPLPHVNPKVGILGEYSLTDPKFLFAIGIAKLVAISFTVLAGYRGGFIFPFMFAGHSIGTGLALTLEPMLGVTISPAAAALCCACSINASVTRTVLATPVVLATLSGRTDVFPMLLVSSIVSLYVTGDEAIIKAARKRWLRKELEGSELLTDRNPHMERNRVVVMNRSNRSTPHHSTHGGSAWLSACPEAGGANGTTPTQNDLVSGVSAAFDKKLNA